MKKFLLTTTLAVLGALSLHADSLAVYKQNVTTKFMGESATAKITFKGWTILDFDTSEIAMVITTPDRTYIVNRPAYHRSKISISPVKAYAMIRIDQGFFPTMTLRGANSYINVFPGTNFEMFSRATASGNFLSTDIYLEYKGNLVFDAVDSQSPLNLTVDEKVTFFTQQLQAQGYTKAPSSQ